MSNNSKGLTQETLRDILTFFVTIAQKKILTRAKREDLAVANYYND